jgi:LPS-assembly protein
MMAAFLDLSAKDSLGVLNAIKKITLIDGLSVNGSYNLLADSFALSGFSFSARSNLFEKINITASATTDPYDVDSRGERTKNLIWKRKPLSLGRLTGGNVSLQSQFKGGSKDKKDKGNQKDLGRYQQQYDPATGLPLDEYQQEAAYINNNPGEFADFSIPWSVNFSYSLRFQRDRKADLSGYETRFFQDINWNGDLNLTPKWKLGINGKCTAGKWLSMLRPWAGTAFSILPSALNRVCCVTCASTAPVISTICKKRRNPFMLRILSSFF